MHLVFGSDLHAAPSLSPCAPPAGPALLCLAAALWRGLEVAPETADVAADVSAHMNLVSGGKRHPGMARRVSSGGSLEAGGGGAEGGRRSSDGAEAGGGDAAQQEASGHSVLLMGATSDGRVWQWRLPLLGGTLPEPRPPALPPAPKPELLGELCCFCGSVLPARCYLVSLATMRC